MRPFQRAAAPEFLAERSEEWGLDWQTRQASGAAFNWHIVTGEPVNRKLLPTLKAQTQNHCSFCDAFPVSPPSIDTIEHFFPKAEFPLSAYVWENLYFCCCYCQQKDGAFEDAVIRPDAADYTFDRYFRWDFTLGTIAVNELAPVDDQHRAITTIKYFRLNESHPTCRKLEARKRSGAKNESLENFAYRDFVEGDN